MPACKARASGIKTIPHITLFTSSHMSSVQVNLPPGVTVHPDRATPLTDRGYLYHTCDRASVCTAVLTGTGVGLGIREVSVHILALRLPGRAVLQTWLGIRNPALLAVKWI